jgi:hypothetical protein
MREGISVKQRAFRNARQRCGFRSVTTGSWDDKSSQRKSGDQSPHSKFSLRRYL